MTSINTQHARTESPVGITLATFAREAELLALEHTASGDVDHVKLHILRGQLELIEQQTTMLNFLASLRTAVLQVRDELNTTVAGVPTGRVTERLVQRHEAILANLMDDLRGTVENA